MTDFITFVGWYGRQNAGDEAFKEVHKHLFTDRCAFEWIDDRTAPAQVSGRREWVLGGGDVLSDFYASQIPADAPFSLYGVGVGGVEEFAFIERNRERIRAAWVRNRGDVARLESLGIQAHFTPDIVFQLRPAYEGSQARDPAGERTRKRLVIFLSANAAQAAVRTHDKRMWHYYGFFQRELALFCDFISDFYDVVFYPLSTNANDDDRQFSREVRGFMKKPEQVRVLAGDDSIEEIVAMVQKSDLVLSMKFHGIVFSALSGVPFINIGLSRKTQLLCTDNGLDMLSMPPYSLSFHSLSNVVKVAEQPETRARVREVGARLSEAAAQQGQAFRDFILGV